MPTTETWKVEQIDGDTVLATFLLERDSHTIRIVEITDNTEVELMTVPEDEPIWSVLDWLTEEE